MYSQTIDGKTGNFPRILLVSILLTKISSPFSVGIFGNFCPCCLVTNFAVEILDIREA